MTQVFRVYSWKKFPLIAFPLIVLVQVPLLLLLFGILYAIIDT